MRIKSLWGGALTLNIFMFIPYLLFLFLGMAMGGGGMSPQKLAFLCASHTFEFYFTQILFLAVVTLIALLFSYYFNRKYFNTSNVSKKILIRAGFVTSVLYSAFWNIFVDDLFQIKNNHWETPILTTLVPFIYFLFCYALAPIKFPWNRPKT